MGVPGCYLTIRWTRGAIARLSACRFFFTLSLARARVNFYEAGSGQEVIRVDWFTLLFKVTRVSHRGGGLLFVASVNGATKLILNHEVCPQVDARAFRHLNHSEPSL